MERAVVAGGMTVMRGSAHVTLRSTVTARAAFATPSMSGSGSEWVWLNWRRAGGMWWRSPTPMPTPRSDLSPLELRRRCRRTGGSSNEEWHVSDSYTYTIYIHYNVTLLQDILVYPFKLELITCQISNCLYRGMHSIHTAREESGFVGFGKSRTSGRDNTLELSACFANTKIKNIFQRSEPLTKTGFKKI